LEALCAVVLACIVGGMLFHCILHLLPFLDSLLDGSLAKTEEEANIAPFKIGDVSFNWLVVFVDGIYPTQ
jgi:hypothetical protein